jgi:hypothetical protein
LLNIPLRKIGEKGWCERLERKAKIIFKLL